MSSNLTYFARFHFFIPPPSFFCKLLKSTRNYGISSDPFKEDKELCWYYKNLWYYRHDREVETLLSRAINGVGNTILYIHYKIIPLA